MKNEKKVSELKSCVNREVGLSSHSLSSSSRPSLISRMVSVDVSHHEKMEKKRRKKVSPQSSRSV